MSRWGQTLPKGTPPLSKIHSIPSFCCCNFCINSAKIESLHVKFTDNMETTLLRRLQALTLPNATPQIGKIHPFSKMNVTFETLMGFSCSSGFGKFLITRT